jgi:hypothetical protein
MHLMSAPEGNSLFCFPESLNVSPRVSMFPETKSRETLRFEGKQNYFPREQTLSVLLYSIATNKNQHSTINFIQQLYFVTKTL